MGNKAIESISSETDKEFISMYAREMGISVLETKRIFNMMVECIRRCIDMNGYINLRRLGRFCIKRRKRSRFRNFEGQIVELSVMYMLKFYSSDSMKSLINHKMKREVEQARYGKKK